jgi:hypothetical protein
VKASLDPRVAAHLPFAKGGHRVLAARRRFGANTALGRTVATAPMPSFAAAPAVIPALSLPPTCSHAGPLSPQRPDFRCRTDAITPAVGCIADARTGDVGARAASRDPPGRC